MNVKDIKIKMPKTEGGLKNFFNSCKNRNKFIEDTEFHYKKHLKKAKHDLARAIAEFHDNCWDWTVVKSYYSIFHAGNALLSKNRRLFSKDHSCLIVALKYWNLISENIFNNLMKTYEWFSDIASIDITFQLRKISQYDVDLWEDITKKNAEEILEFAKTFVSYVEDRI